MDLSKLSDDDLRALSENNLGGMSDAGLKLIAGGGAAPVGKKGFGAALGKGFESTVGAGQTTLESLFGANEAAQRGLRREEDIAGKYADQVGLDKLKEAYASKGITGAAGELGRQIPLAVLEQAPNIAASLGGAKLGAMAGSAVMPGVGTAIGAGLGALAPTALQLFGSNVQRQAAEQEQAGQPVDINVGRAAAATAVQAPLDVAATFIPLGGKVAGKFFGPEVEKLLARGGSKAAEKLAQESFLKTGVKGLATGAAAEIPTEILQQVAERAQAGLALTSPDALKEYGETAYQVGLLAPIGGAGRFIDKSAAKTQVEEKKQEDRRVAIEQDRIAKEVEQQREEAIALNKAQQQTGQLFGEAAPTEQEASLLPGAPSTLTVAEKEAQAASQQGAQESDRSRLLKNYDLFQNQLLDIEKQRDTAAEKGDFKQFGALDQQARALEEQNKELLDKLKTTPGLHYLKEEKKYVALTPEVEMAKLRGEQKNLIKQLQGMTGPSYDAKKAATVTAKLEELDKKIAEAAPAAAQLDLFEPAQLAAEERQAKAQQQEARTQEQADLLQQVQKPSKKEVVDQEAIDRYQKGLQDLEEAYAAGADERIINRLVDELQRVGQEKEQAIAKVAGVKTGAEQEQENVRIERIKRAVAEEEAKLGQATTDKDVATIRADVAALKQRLTQAQIDRATGRPEKARDFALEDQQEAFRDAVENVRTILSGEYFNSFNPDVASSLKSGIEADIRRAGANYTEAALREINAERTANKQQALTNDEALKVASAIKERFDFIAKDPTYLSDQGTKFKKLNAELKATDKKDVKKIERLKAAIKEIEDNRGANLRIFEQALVRAKDQVRKGPTKLQKERPLLRQQFGKPEKEEVGTLAKDMGLTVREKEAGKKPDLSNINPDQRELFGEKELEPVATVRATPENFRKFLGSASVFKLKEKLKALTVQAEKQEQQLSKKFTLPSKEFLGQLEEQRRFVAAINSGKIVTDALRAKATQLWNTNTRSSIQEADSIIDQIDAIYEEVAKLENANLKAEKAILDSMERKLAALEKGSPAAQQFKKYADRARSIVAQTEGDIEKATEKQAKEKRILEEKRAEALKGLPFIRREVVTSSAKAKGSGEGLMRKKTTGAVFPSTKDKKTGKETGETVYPVTPKTAEEKREEARARAAAGAAERKADKEAIKARLGTSQIVESKELTAVLDRQAGRAAERIAAKPGREERKKPLKTGVKRVDVTKQGMKIARDVEQEARDAGVSREDFEWVQNGLDFGFKARAEKAPATAGSVSQADVKKELAKIKLPKGLKIVVFDKLGGALAEKIQAAGHNPKDVRGGVLPDGTVIIVAENHKDINDVKETIAHELIGHLGVEQMLGEAGMKALAKQIQKTDDSVFELAKKLGVFDDVLGAYANARRTKSEEDSVLDAVRELIAHVEETRPTRNFLEGAKAFIKALVGAVRASLRKMGLDLDISTSDIYKILRDARKQFNEGSPGAYVNKDGDIMYRTKPAVANAGFEDVLDYSDKIVAKEKSLIDKIKGEATGMIFKTKYIDRFAPIQAVANQMKDALKATQLMYFLRMHDQRMAFTSEVASNGPLDLKTAKDGRGMVIESTPGANLQDMAAALKDADVGNSEATSRVFTMYLAAKRAKRVGLDKLNFGDSVTQKMLDDTMRAVENNPATKAAFEKAAGIYAEYNKGLINFAVKTGAIPKDIGTALNKDGDYVPFYRQRADGSVFLDIGGAPAIKIGNLTDQPYLHELVGGDKPIFDVYTSALQNTSMLTDMALRNLATRNTAFALGDMGLLKVGDKEKGVGLRKGDGPKGPDIIRFKIDGENYFAEVNTTDIGIPSELLVKGLEGVNTSLPNIVKAMNVPANLLRKWVTRNPAYALRQVVRDPLNAVMTTGLDTVPIVSSFKEITKMIRGKSEGEPLLQRRGILGGQVLTGTSEDMTKILRDVTAGKKGWEYRMAQLDQLAIQGDAATRVVMYNNFIKQGLSEMEATLATLEAMNFSKRGISPSLFALSTMVPFMNAQIQGLNVIYQAFTGKMPFNEKLKVKQKLIQRGLMMMGFTMLYASLMGDDEAYQNANDDEKYGNWFIPSPFGEEPIKVPIPFEMGLIFKAIPEALVNTMSGDEKARDTMSAIGKMAWNSIPISGPQGVKPLLEVAINHSFFTGREIESARLQRYEPGERYTERTSEIAKFLGGILGGLPVVGERFLTPTKIEYLMRGYTGSLPLAVASLANPVLRSGEAGEQPEPRGLLSSETPLIGSFFQAKDASGLVNKAYKDMEEINQTKETYKKMVEEGREKEAEAYMEANSDMIAMGTMAGRFRKKMGDLTKAERNIRSDSSLSGAEKRQALDEIRQLKIELAKDFSSARE